MFKKALVGVDLSPAETSLLSCLPDLKRWGVESVILAHVIQVGYAQAGGYGHEDEYRTWLERRAVPLRSAGLTVNTSVTASGDPAEELLEVAKAQGADLVVVGSRSKNFLQEIFLGSVAKEVIRKAAIPVLIERLEPASPGDADSCAAICSQALERVLLATDLSAQSKSAEDAAVRLGGQAGTIDVLTVPPSAAGEEDLASVESRHRELVQRIETRGGKASSRIERGDPTEAVIRVGQEGYSLIIVGKYGRNWIKGKVIGSTAARVCEAAGRPVLMMPLQRS